MFELLGDANGINEEEEIYQRIENKDILGFAKTTLIKDNCALLKINKKK